MIPYILSAVGGYLIGDSMKAKLLAKGGKLSSWETIYGEIVKEISRVDDIEIIHLFSGHYIEVKDNQVIGSDYLNVPNYVIDKINKDLNRKINYDKSKYADGGELAKGGELKTISGLRNLEEDIAKKIDESNSNTIKAKIYAKDKIPEIKRYAKHSYGILEMKEGSKKWGIPLSVKYDMNDEFTIRYFDDRKDKTYADELELKQKYIQKNRHPNLWQDLADEYNFSQIQLDKFRRETVGLSHSEAYSKAGDYGLPQIETHKTITMTSAGMPEYAQKELKKAIEEKRDYRYSWDCGYDCSVSTKMGEDGIYRGWFSQEFRGTGNGHYWLLISPTQAIYAERD